MRLGVDFGTTNSAIALYDGQQLKTIQVDRVNDNADVMPSLLYVDRSHHVTTGAQAANAYLQYETGRPVRWRQHEAGEIEITVASLTSSDPIAFTQAVNVMVDEAANGRLIQSIKTALFNARYEGTQIFDRFFRVESLIALILSQLKQAAEHQLETTVDQIVLGRPVQFSDNPVVDYRAESILFQAAHLAGFKDVTFELEPVGVAYLQHRNSRERQTALVFDFGGGTLDLTIADVGGDRPPNILATGGVALGGNDLDQRIMKSLLPYFGGGDDGILPSALSDKLLAWQTMPELSRPRYREIINRLQRAGHQSEMRALETLISNNIGFKLFKEIERVKKQLSTTTSAQLHFEFEDVHIQETITRRRFDRMIAGDVARIDSSIHNLLAAANLEPAAIDIVLRTGGSSQIPAFSNLLGRIFGDNKIKAIDPLISVTGGFAVVAHERPLPVRPELNTVTAIQTTTGPYTTFDTYHLIPGVPVYTDRDFVVNRMPPVLDNTLALRLANNDFEVTDDQFLHFCLERPAQVYVAYDAAAEELPRWLRTFQLTPLRIEIEDEFALIRRTLNLYSRDYQPGQVMLGGNMASGAHGPVLSQYLVVVQPLA